MSSTRRILVLFILSSFIFFSACNTFKEVPLFQDASESETTARISNYDPIMIQPNDILGLGVSSLNPAAAAIFSPPPAETDSSPGAGTSKGFLVDKDGNINIPFVGQIKVAGISSGEAGVLIAEKLKPYLKEPVINVQLLNFKIGVFGGVSRPGIFRVENERINILEALILAGDLELTAKRSNLLLIREIKGERRFVRLDLRTLKTLQSPYYFLQPNDLLYIEPGTSTEKRNNLLGTVSIGVSLVSLLVILARL